MLHTISRRSLALAASYSLALLGGAALVRATEPQGARPDLLAAPGEARVVIRSLPYTIERCGAYVVRGCLTGVAGSAGITIDADDVTLDLAGFTLRGVAGSRQGVVVAAGRSNVRVEGGAVRDWGMGGVDASLASAARLVDLYASRNAGVGLATGSGGVLADCIAADNEGDGIQLGVGGRARACSATGNGGSGIVASFVATSTGCVIEDCVARSNALVGIAAGDGTTLTNCSVTQNGTGGVQVGPGCNVAGNCVLLNGGDGIQAFDSLVRGNAVTGNTTSSINATGSTVLENHE